jgi:excinuclease ABC subunit A
MENKIENKIVIKRARVHNLKDISLEIPKNKIIVFTGVSGSGKSSLAFDTIFAEGQRRYIESLSPYARQFLGQMKRADVDEISGLSPAIAINQKALSRNPRSIVGTLTEIYDFMRVLFARLGEVYCPLCGGRIERLSPEEIVDTLINFGQKNSASELFVLAPVVRGRKGEYYQLLYDFLNLGYFQARIDGRFHSLHERIELARYKPHNIEIMIDKVPLSDQSRLFEAAETALEHGKGLIRAVAFSGKRVKGNEKEILFSSQWSCPKDNFSFPEIEPRLFSFNSPYGACPACAGVGKKDLFLGEKCPECFGRRLRSESLAVRIGGKNIWQISEMTIDEIYSFFKKYEKSLDSRSGKIAENILKEICQRLEFLLEVGLDYLTLSRESETLSGGEAQRIRLASQIGSRLSDALYVLDEPTIGLHEKDVGRLVGILKKIQKLGNTIIVVEHDDTTIKESDFLVDLGPLAGRLGGEVVAVGQRSELVAEPKKFPRSLTLKYLSGGKSIALPPFRRRRKTESIFICGARANNLKNINVDIPLKKFVVITGVSGSGKSTLLYDVLYKNGIAIKSKMTGQLEGVSRIEGAEHIDRIVMIDQSPIGRTPRSNPATYTGIFAPIREFFASLEESRAKAYKPSRFSFNIQGGRCEACAGAGYNLIEMHFLPPVLVRCEVCLGRRFNRETLVVKYKGKNISDILEMTVDEAGEFFDGIYTITDKIKILKEVGLGYLKLGQNATTLSGGEAQRIKLARELSSPLGKRTLYLLDEPTVGLHYYDIEMLLEVFGKLVDQGNSLVVIEHNMHIVKSADYIIDLGPGGGKNGGKVVAKGLPEEIVCEPKSFTGQCLKKYL